MTKYEGSGERLAREAEATRDLIQWMREIEPEEDDALMDSMIEGETNFKEALEFAVQTLQEAEVAGDAIRELRERLLKRQQRFEAIRTQIRGMIAMALARANGDGDLKRRPFRVSLPSATLTLKQGLEKIEIDEARLPAKYFVTPSPKVNRTAVTEAITDGKKITGVRVHQEAYALIIRKV